MTFLLTPSFIFAHFSQVVFAIEKQPKLLFLIRLAPYPYNLMNTLLASSRTLSLKTYTICTALALPKLLVHCWLGANISSFGAYHGVETSNPSSSNSTIVDENPSSNSTDSTGAVGGVTDEATASAERTKRIAGFVGVGLCIGIFLYLLVVARRAVDELDDEDEDDGVYDVDALRRNRRAVDGSDEEKSGSVDESDRDLSDEDEEDQLLSNRRAEGSNFKDALVMRERQADNSFKLNGNHSGSNSQDASHRISSSSTSSSTNSNELSLAEKIAEMEFSAESYDTGRHRSGSEAAKRGLGRNGDEIGWNLGRT